MKSIILIPCAAKKASSKCKAEELYISPLFKKQLEYAKSFDPDKIFILSAKHQLLNLGDIIEPYNETLNSKSTSEIKQWSKEVFEKLKLNYDLEEDYFMFLTGEKYRKYLIPHIKHVALPTKGLKIGQQLKFFNEQNL